MNDSFESKVNKAAKWELISQIVKIVLGLIFGGIVITLLWKIYQLLLALI